MNTLFNSKVIASAFAIAALSLVPRSVFSASSFHHEATAQRSYQPESPNGSIVISYRKLSQPIP